MEHTPTPWVVVKDTSKHYQSIGGAYFIRGPKGEYVARITDETSPRKVNAEHIIVCVNSHAGLLGALESTWDMIRTLPLPKEDITVVAAVKRALAESNAAITKAGG